MNQPNVHGLEVETRLKALGDKLRGLKVPEPLLKYIRMPGWTTPAELVLIHHLMDSVGQHIAMIEANMKAMEKASEKMVNQK